MRPRFILSRTSAAILALAALAAPYARAFAQDDADAPEVAKPAPLRDINAMSTTDLAREAARHMQESAQQEEHYTYLLTEHNQNFIGGMKVVDRVSVLEAIDIGGRPYLHKISDDGKPLVGKALAQEEKAYTTALHDRTAFDANARALAMNHATRNISRTNLDRLADDFQLKLDAHQDVDGNDCITLDATPKPNANPNEPQLQRHIRLAIDSKTHDVLDVSIEFLSSDQEFGKGSILETHYREINGVPLRSEQIFDTTVTFKELANTPIHVHRVQDFTKYRRFKSTVTILSSVPTDGTVGGADAATKPNKPEAHQP